MDLPMNSHRPTAISSGIIFTVVVFTWVRPVQAQENASNRFDDERLKTRFVVSHPADFFCPLPSDFIGLKRCFSNADTLEAVLVSLTNHMAIFLESEPDSSADEQLKLFWYCDVFWTDCDSMVQPSMRCSVHPIDGTMQLFSNELRLRQEP